MHTPDGYLDPWVAAFCAVVSIAVLAFAVRRTNGRVTEPKARLFGLVTAGIFTVQMLNWPIPGGTSAHFVGGAFAAIVLGPHLAALSVTSVLGIQALVFGDGGVAALGANVLSMAIVEVYVGYAIYRGLAGYDEFAAAFVAGWLGITVAALATALQLGVSAPFAGELASVVLIMGVGHLALGLIEGAITAIASRTVGDVPSDATPEPSVSTGVRV